jgi:hypothetical protein
MKNGPTRVGQLGTCQSVSDVLLGEQSPPDSGISSIGSGWTLAAIQLGHHVSQVVFFILHIYIHKYIHTYIHTYMYM